MTSIHRSRRVAVAAVLTATAGLALWSAPQGFAAVPPNVGAFDPQPDPPGCRMKIELVDKDTRGYGVPDTVELLPPGHGCAAIIIHYNQPVDPAGLAGKR